MSDRPNGLTYAEAGVDIDAGAALVEAIKPLARSTRRRGADAALGGFGALFDLKAAGFVDPLIVSTTDGVGTKLKVAIESGHHDTVGIDLVAMYGEGDYDLAGFSIGAVERGGVLPRLPNQAAGDLLIGLASSGPHSNG